MTVNTIFYFDIETEHSSLIKIRQKKFKEVSYQIDSDQIVSHTGLTSLIPVSFLIKSDREIKINNLKFSIDQGNTQHNINLIYYKINGIKYQNKMSYDFTPIKINNDDMLEIRIFFNVVNESST